MKRLIFLSLVFLLFIRASFASTKIATDPSRLGVGARILGMGKSYVGMADDLGGIFTNPAALAEIPRWQATSMSGKFLNEYNYLNAGTAVPTPFGSIGIGYVGSGISFYSPSTTIEVIDGVRVIPSSTEGNSYNYNNRVTLVSWGGVLHDFSFGATVKFFAVDLSGPGISNGTASGNDLDVGAKYKPNSFFGVGAVLQNVLSLGGAGRLKWANNTEETLPHVMKMGASLKLLGEEGWRQIGKQALALNLDSDATLDRSNVPVLFHLGLEWSPAEFLDLRAGIDQETIGSGTGTGLEASNNLTMGVGLYFNQYRFDYAFHQYNQISENDTHYFSISYGMAKREKAEVKGPPFILTPEDKSILYEDKVVIGGKTIAKGVAHATINRQEVSLGPRGFEATWPLNLGKNDFAIEGFSRDWRSLGTARLRLIRLKRFNDVAADHWAKLPIEQLTTLNIISGYTDGSFKPEKDITKAELRLLLMRALPPGEATIEVRAGPVTRAEGVAMIARFAGLPKASLAELPFPDVPGRHWAVKAIASAREAGMLKYLEGKPFEPAKNLTRAEVAEMLASILPQARELNK